ncbi:MAG: GTP-binding protein [Betaproteobacteria bacterium HGW-Betaproteobacteria-11]|nr:MAG: GTP-binding protein [Betaproteobacteria bacterium HGW-Betaproteobacteria-11]
MNVDHHDLHHEFPQHSGAIHGLKQSNHHFARLCDEYHALTSKIEALEGRDLPLGDVAFEEMKKQRLRLKDDLYRMLQSEVA